MIHYIYYLGFVKYSDQSVNHQPCMSKVSFFSFLVLALNFNKSSILKRVEWPQCDWMTLLFVFTRSWTLHLIKWPVSVYGLWNINGNLIHKHVVIFVLWMIRRNYTQLWLINMYYCSCARASICILCSQSLLCHFPNIALIVSETFLFFCQWLISYMCLQAVEHCT